jgi:hypothetical protein
MANNLKDHLKEVADAIRAKKGTNDLINPQDFATEIEGISGSGGGEESDWIYYDCSSADNSIFQMAMMLPAILKKAEVRDGIVSGVKIGSPAFTYLSSDYAKIIAIAVDFSQPCIDANGTRTLREQIALYPNSELAQIVGMLQSFPRITKEQFYSLE